MPGAPCRTCALSAACRTRISVPRPSTSSEMIASAALPLLDGEDEVALRVFVDHTVVEQHTVAHRHGKIQIKQVQSALYELESHGLIKYRQVKLEKFKEFQYLQTKYFLTNYFQVICPH